MKDSGLLPSLSIIVPTLNQAKFLEETICSILEQDYPGLELIVVDGGSTDETLDLIKTYENQITKWISEKDNGQADAINKGLKMATAEWVAWMNSDDCYLAGTLVPFFKSFDHKNYDFVYGVCSSGETLDSRVFYKPPKNYKQTVFDLLLFFMKVENIIPSQSVFVRRSILERVGYLDVNLHFVLDMEWFVRIYLNTDSLRRYYYDFPISFYRKHRETKTSTSGERMLIEARQVAQKYIPSLGRKEQWQLGMLLKNDAQYKNWLTKSDSINEWLKIFWQAPMHVWLKYGTVLSRLKQIVLRNNLISK